MVTVVFTLCFQREKRRKELLEKAEEERKAKEEAEKERQTIEGENKAKEQYRQSLDSEIADKERQLKDKRNRGFINHVTARMLVPMQYLPDFDNDREGYVYNKFISWY